jgi:hypothetical protein
MIRSFDGGRGALFPQEDIAGISTVLCFAGTYSILDSILL